MPMPKNDTYRFKKEFEKAVAEMNGKKESPAITQSPAITPKKTNTNKNVDFLEESRKRLKDRESEFKKPDTSSKEKIKTAFSDTKERIDTQNKTAWKTRKARQAASAVSDTLRKAFTASGNAPEKTSGSYVKGKGATENTGAPTTVTRSKKMTAAQVEAKRAKQAAYKAKQDAKKAAQRQKANNAQAKKTRR